VSDEHLFHDAETDHGTGDPGGVVPVTISDSSQWPPVRRLGADGRYHLEERIAAGGAATVWRAYDAHLDRSVAVKILHPHLITDPDTVRRFERESRHAARLHHPNAIRIYDSGRIGDVVYLVMEFVDGPSLKDLLIERGAMPNWEVVAAIGEQVAAVLSEAHSQGLIHRDIKPANILFSSDGLVKAADFGIAKALSGATTDLTAEGMTVGTATYIAPEQYTGDEIDQRTDLYALGMVLYECLTGRPAYVGDTPAATAAARLTREVLPPRQVRADVDRRLDDLIVRCTRRDPRDRYPDAATVQSTLRSLIGQRSPQDLTAELLASKPPDRPQRPEFPRLDSDMLTDPGLRTGKTNTRLIGSFLAGIALTVVAIAVIVSLGGRVPGVPNADGSQPLPVSAITDYDPSGDDGREHPDEVAFAVDRSLETAWTTETYRGSPRFGDRKPGVGLIADLTDSTVTSIQVLLDADGTASLTDKPNQAGMDVEIYAAASRPEDVDGLLGWGEPVGTFVNIGPQAELQLSAPVTARYFLVWITQLPEVAEDSSLYRAGIAELQFFGAANGG